MTIRPRSVLGLKYVDMHIGTSQQIFADGGTMPITQTTVPVQFEDIFQMFDPKTRTAIQNNLVGFGDTLAGRGSALNDTIASLPRAVRPSRAGRRSTCRPQHAADAASSTRSSGFMGAVAPVAQTNAQLFTDMATTFEAISRSPTRLEATISESPSTEEVSTELAARCSSRSWSTWPRWAPS